MDDRAWTQDDRPQASRDGPGDGHADGLRVLVSRALRRASILVPQDSASELVSSL